MLTQRKKYNPIISADMAGKRLFRYKTDLADMVIKSDVRLPTGKGYPPHISHQRMWNWGRGGWLVKCLVCGRSTGKKKDRKVLAAFLKRHRRCGFISS